MEKVERPEPTAPREGPPELDLQEVRVLRLQPGDTVALMVPAEKRVSQEEVARMTKLLAGRFPGHKTIVVAGADLIVVRGEEDGTG